MRFLRLLSFVVLFFLLTQSAAADEVFLPIGGIERTLEPATVTLVDAQGDAASIAIGADGLPIISFVSSDCSTRYTCIRVVRCADAACTTVSETVEVDDGLETTIAIGSDQLPVIVYGSPDPQMEKDHIKVAHCEDIACATSTETIVYTPEEYATPAMVIGSDGLPFIISIGFGGLQTIHCEDVACTEVTTAAIADNFNGNSSGAVAVGADGLPLIAYSTGLAIKLARCEDITCSSYSTNVIADADANNLGPSLVVGADGLPLISYHYIQMCCIVDGKLKVAHCQDASCQDVVTTTVDEDGNVGAQNAVLISSSGAPFIVYVRWETGDEGYVTDADFRVARCEDSSCASSTIASWGRDYAYPSMAVGSDGLIVMAVSDSTGMSVIHCNDFDCTAPD